MIFNCPQCGQAIEANDSIASQKVKCPTCLTDFTAPSPQEHYMAEPQVPPVADPSVHQDTPPLSAENTKKQIDDTSAAFILGIISIPFGASSIVLGLLPFIGAFLSISTAIIGVILGVIGFIFAATKKFQGATIPVIGIMLSIFGLFSTSHIYPTFAKKTSNILQQGLVSRANRAKMNIETFQTAAIKYKIYSGDYPTTEQGLEALFTRPTNVRAWEGPYIRESDRDLLIDPWGNLYNYRWVKDETPDIFHLVQIALRERKMI